MNSASSRHMSVGRDSSDEIIQADQFAAIGQSSGDDYEDLTRTIIHFSQIKRQREQRDRTRTAAERSSRGSQHNREPGLLEAPQTSEPPSTDLLWLMRGAGEEQEHPALALGPETEAADGRVLEPVAPSEQKVIPTLNKLVVSVYKVIGFGVLSLIVFGLVSYLAVSLFFFVSNSWLLPTVVSPTDERVLRLSAQMAKHKDLRDQLVSKLKAANRTVATHEEFKRNFKRAVRSDLEERRAQLRQLQELVGSHGVTRRQIRRSNRTYISVARRRIRREYRARLVDTNTMVNSNFQLAQVANANLSLAQMEVQLKRRISSLKLEIEALEQVLSPSSNGKLSYDVLRIRQDYQKSLLEASKARDERTDLEQSMRRYDRILETIADSPHIKAAQRSATIAFVPYDNLDNVSTGTPIFGCALKMLWCREVGRLVKTFAGEVTIKHPTFHSEPIRGQMVQIELRDDDAAQKPVLFAGGPPLLL